MKTTQQWLAGIIIGIVCAVPVSAQEATFAELNDDVLKGCPHGWEELTVGIDLTSIPVPLWKSGDPTDIEQFKAMYHLVNDEPDGSDDITEAEMDAVLASNEAISLACNGVRRVLFQAMLATNSSDSAAALAAALGVADAIDLSSRSWRVGDVRSTGQSTPADGWLFPVGQTIGAIGSGADMEGEQYKDLFNQAKAWQPNQNNEVFGSANSALNTVTLPDLRGRSIFTQDDMLNDGMGGAKGVVTNAEADKIGGVFGLEKYSMTSSQMPSHNHAMNTIGNHSHDSSAVGSHSHGMNNSPSHIHSMGYAGTHGHNIRTSVYGGSNVPNWGTYFTGQGRPGYESTKSAPIVSAGNHKHSIGAGGVHKHTVLAAGGHDHSISTTGNHKHTNVAAGGGAAMTTVSPGIAFNTEMKY